MDESKLQQLTEQLSNEKFGRPFKHSVRFNNRLRTTGGRYMLQDHTIEVNPKHLMLFGEQEIIDILKHELCHYHLHLEGRGYRHKDPEFKALLAQVGGARFCQRIPEAKQTSQARHVYVCTLCYEVYVRKKRMNLQKYRCGVCRGLLKQKEVSYEKK